MRGEANHYIAFILFMEQLTFEELFTFENLYLAYVEARGGKRSKGAEAFYEQGVLDYTRRLTSMIRRGQYRPSRFEIFTVYEPKKRLVQAPAFVDKVALHCIVDNLLYEAITKSFIFDSYASQIDKGTFMGLYRIKCMFVDYWRKNKTSEGWILKADVRQFFHSIDHEQLKRTLKPKIQDAKIFDVLCMFIDASEEGLPLGYQTSQLLALMYLDSFDHFVKEELRERYYGRYMDDFAIICRDKEHLKEVLRKVNAYIGSKGLELNEKTNIFPLRNGIDFLGFHTYLTESGKVIRKVRRSSIQRQKRKIKYWREAFPAGKITKLEIIASWEAWDAHAAHGQTRELRKKIAKQVSEIIGKELIPRKPIRDSMKMQAKIRGCCGHYANLKTE